MTEMNPIRKATKGLAVASLYESEESKKGLIGQMDVPWEKRTYRFAPWVLKCDHKVVKYDSRGFNIWRALLSFSHTILSDMDTWYHLNYLTIICAMTMAICVTSGSYRSIEDTSSVTTRIQTLISFIFAAYVTIVINRWDRIRNTTLGQQWGASENLVMIVGRLIKIHKTQFVSTDPEKEEAQGQAIQNKIIRYCRLIMRLTFLAAQGDEKVQPLIDAELLTQKEADWLMAGSPGTRPLMVVIWIGEIFDAMVVAGYKIPDPVMNNIVLNLANLRGGIGATLGAIGTQLPYGYVHLIYWTVQILLLSLAIETGVILSTDLYYKANGQGFYSPPDDNVAWPAQPNVWYSNVFLQLTAGNIVFALFTEGALKIMDKLSNPMSMEDSSLSERVFGELFYCSESMLICFVP